MDARAVVIVPAAGSGARLGAGAPKAFVELHGRSMLLVAAEAALASGAVQAVVVAVPAGLETEAGRWLEPLGERAVVVTGGATRQASVRAALAVVPDATEIVLCHDAARPLASPALFEAVISALAGDDDGERVDGVVPVVPIPDTVKRVRQDLVVATEPRGELALAQTPQAFRAAALRDAHARAERAGKDFTDDAAALEWAGYRVRVVPGEPGNFKITSAQDLVRAETARG